MTDALHLRHLESVWAKDGPLQASLAEALRAPETTPPPSRPPVILKSVHRLRETIEGEVDRHLTLAHKWIAKLDQMDGDTDLEEEPDLEDGSDAEAETGS
jgi:hypothetical protein